MTHATQVTERCTYHGEGTFWDAVSGRLLLVDMLAGAIVAVAADGSTRRHDYGGIAAMIRARSRGGYVLAVEHGWQLLDADLAPIGEPVLAFDDPEIRMNEGGCDPAGRLFTGSMAYDQAEGAASMWRLDPDGTVSKSFGGVTISNGLQWSADGTAAFYNDTPTSTIWRYDYDVSTGTFGDRRPFATVPDDDGFPDGMAIDADGGIWTAVWGGSAVRRYDADGVLSEVVELPVPRITSCAFGGDDLRTLYISTSREGLLDDAEEPLSGAVFAVDAGVAGAAPHPFAG